MPRTSNGGRGSCATWKICLEEVALKLQASQQRGAGYRVSCGKSASEQQHRLALHFSAHRIGNEAFFVCLPVH